MRVPDLSATATGYAALLTSTPTPTSHNIGSSGNSTLDAFAAAAQQQQQQQQQAYYLSAAQATTAKQQRLSVAKDLPYEFQQVHKQHSNYAYLNGNGPAPPALATSSTPTAFYGLARNAFENSADEFVQRALNSHATPQPAQQITTTPTIAAAAVKNHYNHQAQHQYLNSQRTQRDYNNAVPAAEAADVAEVLADADVNELYALAENSTENTYRSFKEIFNNNKTFFEECVKDFENINTLRHLSHDDAEELEASSHYAPQQQQQHTSPLATLSPTPSPPPLPAPVSPLPSEPDADDAAMKDLCQSPGHDAADERSQISTRTASASSVCSITQSKRFAYYPRGIINPNYPGFQHLAHTLSEHFIGGDVGSASGSASVSPCGSGSPTDSYDDSEMSEYEMELSADDSFDDLPDEEADDDDHNINGAIERDERNAQHRQHNDQYNNNNNNNNCNEHNITVEEQQQHQQQQLEQHSNMELEQNGEDIVRDDEDRHTIVEIMTAPASAAQSSVPFDDNRNAKQQIDIQNLPHNLASTLILLDVTSVQQQQQQYTMKDMDGDEDGSRLDAQPTPTTPDILIKNNYNFLAPSADATLMTGVAKENRPDLLRGVSPHRKPPTAPPPAPQNQPLELATQAESTKVTAAAYATAKQQRLKQAMQTVAAGGHYESGPTMVKDEMSFGMTPVDIIGDFGQEVEREFGLLVSGYKRVMEEHHQQQVFEGVAMPQNDDKLLDAMLSSAKDELNAEKYLTALKGAKYTSPFKEGAPLKLSAKSTTITTTTKTVATIDYMEDSNAVDWSSAFTASDKMDVAIVPATVAEQEPQTATTTTKTTTMASQLKPAKYQKASYDDRQLPPVAIDYKRCQQSMRMLRKTQHAEKSGSGGGVGGGASLKIVRNHHAKTGFTNRLWHSGGSGGGGGGSGGGGAGTNAGSNKKRNANDKNKTDNSNNNNNRKREEAELYQYQQLINDKEAILSNSKYTKLSTWAQYLKSSVVKEHQQRAVAVASAARSKGFNGELISPSALDLFDAYKIGGREIDMETLQQHLKLAKEIEKKRRSDREEIRRRLAMGAEGSGDSAGDMCATGADTQTHNDRSQCGIWRNSGSHFCQISEFSSDTESHSSDSETCPKLSKMRQQQQLLQHDHPLDLYNRSSSNLNLNININNNNNNTHALTTTATMAAAAVSVAAATTATIGNTAHPYHGRPLTISCTKSKQQLQKQSETQSQQQQQQQQQQQIATAAAAASYSDEDRECNDFFTKQARLQIEARMALGQAKEMAHMQMQLDRQHQRMSPITAFIRGSLDKVGVQMVAEKRRVSRQLLTELNIAQLQILVNSLHSHIEQLNEFLVKLLMERDDLHMNQDAILADIEQLTRFIGSHEQQAKLQLQQKQQQQQQQQTQQQETDLNKWSKAKRTK